MEHERKYLTMDDLEDDYDYIDENNEELFIKENEEEIKELIKENTEEDIKDVIEEDNINIVKEVKVIIEDEEEISEEYKDKITYEDLSYQSWDASLEKSFMTALKKMDDNSYSDEPVISVLSQAPLYVTNLNVLSFKLISILGLPKEQLVVSLS